MESGDVGGSWCIAEVQCNDKVDMVVKHEKKIIIDLEMK
jgi:hypothetical protein